MRSLFFKHLEQFQGSYPFGYKKRWAQIHLQVHFAARQTASEKVLCLDDTQYIVETILPNWEARVQGQRDLLLGLVPGVIDVEPDHVAPRPHQRAHGTIAKFEDAFDDVMLRLFEHTRFGTLLHHDLDFFLCDRRFFRWFQVYRLQNEAGRSADQAHNRSGETRQKIHQTRHRGRDSFRIVQRQALWDEFAEDEGEISHQKDDNRKRYGFTVGRNAGDLAQLGNEATCKRPLSIRTH